MPTITFNPVRGTGDTVTAYFEVTFTNSTNTSQWELTEPVGTPIIFSDFPYDDYSGSLIGLDSTSVQCTNPIGFKFSTWESVPTMPPPTIT